jgi:putative N6-adenine-specific DNA methylase
MFDYQKSHRYFAQAPGRMEQLCADELRTLGARDVAPAYRGLYFTADARTLYTINYTSRLISRVLAPLVSFPSPTAAELTARARRVQWERIFLDRRDLRDHGYRSRARPSRIPSTPPSV